MVGSGLAVRNSLFYNLSLKQSGKIYLAICDVAEALATTIWHMRSLLGSECSSRLPIAFYGTPEIQIRTLSQGPDPDPFSSKLEKKSWQVHFRA
jgi:hypothetical protein